jgi:hypothetical protein
MIDPRTRAAALLLAKRMEARKAKLGDYCPHAPTVKQQAFVDHNGLEALYGGAAGGGKSDALLMSALRFIHVPGYAALILRRTFPDLALKGAIMDRSHDWLRGTDAAWDAFNKRWRFPSGATLTFGYLEHPGDETRYQSAEFQSIGFDELTQFQKAQYTYMFSRLRKSGIDVPLRMRGATNPGGIGHAWVKERFAIPDTVEDRVHVHAHEPRSFFPAKLDDNPFVDKESYEIALSQLEAVTKMQLRHGSWKQDSSALVSAFDPDRDLVDELPQLPAGLDWQNVLGIDYGNVNATAFVVQKFCLKFSDIVYTVESQKWDGLDPTAAAQYVKDWSKRHGGFVAMVGDVGGLGKGYAEEARNRWALPIEAAEKQNKYGYIKLLNGAYQNGRKKIVRAANAGLIKEKREHTWKDGKQYIEEQPGSPNHLMDADLYAWRSCVAYSHRAGQPPPPAYGTKEHWNQEAERIRQQYEAEVTRDPFGYDPMANSS